jgi:hypothetical protein
MISRLVAFMVMAAACVLTHAQNTTANGKIYGAAILMSDGSINVITASSDAELRAMPAYTATGSVGVPATGEFHDTINQNGWSTLVIRTDSSFNDTYVTPSCMMTLSDVMNRRYTCKIVPKRMPQVIWKVC